MSLQATDDVLTVCAISLLAASLGNFVHEGLGHAATALLTGTTSGVLSTVAWSSDVDSRLVAAAGTLANLAAALFFWIVLRNTKSASIQLRFFLLTSFAFNILAGTGYFFFSGVTNFGDWAVVIAGLNPHWLWRTLLVVSGMASYYTAIFFVGTGLVRYVGVPRSNLRRLRNLTFIPYFSAVLLSCAGGTLESHRNPAHVAIRAARSGGCAFRTAVVEILHSERNRSPAVTGCHQQELCVDHHSRGRLARFHFRVGTRSYATSINSAPKMLHFGPASNFLTSSSNPNSSHRCNESGTLPLLHT
jgi:hypothetical protein